MRCHAKDVVTEFVDDVRMQGEGVGHRESTSSAFLNVGVAYLKYIYLKI